MGRRYWASRGLLLAVAITLFFGGAIHAQQASSSTSSNGLRVSPVRFDLTIQPGKSQVVDVYVENITNNTVELRGIANDFIASDDESGKPRVLFDEKDYAPSHGLRKYVAPISNFKLAPKERKIVKVTIAMPKDIAGGGYYGAVRFLPAVAASGEKNISLSASVGSLFLVTVPGNIKEQVGIDSFNVSRDGADAKASTVFTNGKNIRTTVRFKNSGNVQEAPFGKILLKKSGKEIANYEINKTLPRGTVLPDSIRRFDIQLGDKAQNIGKYTVEGNFGYGDKGQLISASSTFYVVPLLYILLAGGLVVLIALFAVIIPRMLKEHDRRLIKKMRGKS